MISFFVSSCLLTNVVIAPTAYPGFLGVAIELKSKSFYCETPKTIG